MNNYNVENIEGYTVYSYNVECPYKNKSVKKNKKKHVVLRYCAFLLLAPLALFADAVIAIFQ